MTITEWLEAYDYLVEERTRLNNMEDRLYYDELDIDPYKLGEMQTDNAYAMRDLADEAAIILRSIQRGDHL